MRGLSLTARWTVRPEWLALRPMTLIIRVGPARENWWLEHMQALLPEIACRPWSDPGNPDEIEIAVVWKPPPGGLKRFSNLKLIVSIGADIDHVVADPELFARLPRGASIINAACGGHLVENDLIEALDQGQISAATLDVFETEPLPASSPFWSHPKSSGYAHVASLIDPVSGGKAIAANIKKFLAGEPVADLVHLEQGY